MSRVWLVLAMAVSLWPAAWLSVSIATDSASDSAVSTQAADDTQPTPGDDASGGADDAGAPQEADLDSYMALRDRTDALIDDLDRSHVLRGVSNRRLSDRAASLADDYAAGDERNGEFDYDLHRLARAERNCAASVPARRGAQPSGL